MLTSKRYVVFLLCSVFFFLSTVAIVNYFIDPGAVYFKKKVKVALMDSYVAMLKHSHFGMIQEGWKERDVKLNLAKHIDGKTCIVLGSSHVMMLSTYQVPVFKDYCKRSVNLAVSGGSIEDLLIFMNMLLHYEYSPKVERHVIIGVDPWLLNFDRDFRYKPYKSLMGEGLKVDDHFAYQKILFANLVNWDYFHESIKMIRKKSLGSVLIDLKMLIFRYRDHKSYVLSQKVPMFDIAKGYRSAVTLPDGGHVYSAEYIKKANKYRGSYDAQGYKLLEGHWVDPNAVLLLYNLLSRLKDNGYKITFLFTPYHPDVWQKASGVMTRKAMKAVWLVMKDMAEKLNLEIIGSYDPSAVGCSRDEFYDFMHAMPSCLSKLFK